MLSFTANPGFFLILAALICLGAPRSVRPPLMGVSAIAALWLMLGGQFGVRSAMEQTGLHVVLLNLDALNRIFGIAMLMALVILAIYSSARRNRYEDAAILMLAGGAVSALFVGDLVSFVAAAEISGLGAAWVVFASPLPGANRAGIRMLIWYGLEGLLFLVGVALHLSAQRGSAILDRLDAHVIGDAFVFAALLIRVGAPIAHVWLKDAVAHASAVGAPALSAFSSMLGVYAFARLFPAEPLLIFVGAGMVLIGALMATGSDDFRRAAGYGLTSMSGICVALIGFGSPLALTAAEGHAFAAIFAFLALQMTLGIVVVRHGNAHASSIGGIAGSMPLTITLMLFAGLAVASMPGTAAYATQAVALEATEQWDLRWLWTLIAVTPALLLVAMALRPALVAHRVSQPVARSNETPFPMLLGASIATFFCFSVGIAPGWLYGLMPSELTYQPFAVDQLAPQLELLGSAGVVYVLLWSTRLLPQERPLALLDLDSLYRGPVAGLARWSGVVLLRVYGAGQVAAGNVGAACMRLLADWSRGWDRPYEARFSALAQPLVIAVFIILLLVGRQL